MLLAVALLFALIVVSVLVAGPWQIDVWFTRVSASSVDKPFLVALVAAVLALLLSLGAHAFRRPADAASFYLFAAIVTWAFALGPTLTFMGELSGRPGPFALLQELPGVDGLRVPARFWSMTVLCLATAIGLFVAGALRGRTPRLTRVAVALGGLALLADGWAAPIPAVPSPPRVPDAAALRGGVVLQLPIHPVPDVAATWRAVTGGWRSVNGYSGYVPTHYEALRIAATNADDAMFPPFQRDHELHVVVADEERAAKAAVERQPGAVVVAQSNGMTQYRLPRVATPFPDTSGERLPIAGAASDCAPDRVALALDGDEGTTWECLEDAEAHTLTLDLGVNATVDAVAYSQGRYFWVVPVRLEIDTSVDGAAWTPARHGRVLGELIAGTLRHAPSFGGVLRFAPREARYVRIRPVPDSPDFAWFVSEIEVRAPAP